MTNTSRNILKGLKVGINTKLLVGDNGNTTSWLRRAIFRAIGQSLTLLKIGPARGHFNRKSSLNWSVVNYKWKGVNIISNYK